MFEQQREASYFKRVKCALESLPRRYAVLLLCAVILLVPFPTTVVPEWQLRVIDQNGRPFVNQVVREIWQHYSLEGDGHEEDRITDENGNVVFPERRIWSPLLWRVVSTSLAAASTIMHGSMGISAWVMVIGYSTNRGTRNYEPDKPLPREIRLIRFE